MWEYHVFTCWDQLAASKVKEEAFVAVEEIGLATPFFNRLYLFSDYGVGRGWSTIQGL